MRVVPILATVVLVCAVSAPAGATPAPAPSPSPAAEDFLLLPAQDAAVEGGAAKFRVGDRIRLKVEGDLKEGAFIALPPLMDAAKLREEGFAILQDGRGTKPLLFEVVPLLPGERTLPSLSIQNSSGPDTAFARTNPVQLKIESSIARSDPKPNEPVPLKNPVSLPFPIELTVSLAILALALLGTGAFFVARWLAGRAARAVRAVMPRKPEDAEALQRFDELEKAGYAKKGEHKKHYFGISEALKTYIGRRWEFDAPERTSDEILRHLRAHAQTSDHRVSELQDLFERLDLVKFTDTVPALNEAMRALDDARLWVKETRKPPEPVTTPVTPEGARNGKGGRDAVR